MTQHGFDSRENHPDSYFQKSQVYNLSDVCSEGLAEAHAYFAIPTGWPGCGRSGILVDACNAAGIPQGQHVIDPTHDAIMAVN